MTDPIWREMPKDNLPPGVLRAWSGIGKAGPLCGLFELIDPAGAEGVSYMLAYRAKGAPKTTLERFPGLSAAQARATELMNGRGLALHHLH
jgi:hypothetical protein